ncbi:MAG: hypothetical protein ACI4QE_03830, partial [Acutalibacteraceae bacterium]
MKLIFYELKKVFSKKVFLIIFVLCFILNAFIFYYIQNFSYEKIYIENSEEYNSLIDEYSSFNTEKANEILADKTKAYEIVSKINSTAKSTSTDELDFLSEEIESYKKQNPQAYRLAEKMVKDNHYSETEELFINEIYEQASYISSYPKFIREMNKRADNQAFFSIFGNTDSFAYKNLYKTSADYKHLSKTTLKIGNDYPITSVINYSVSDYFLIAIIFLVCIYLFSYERNKGIYNLIYATKKGRLHTAVAKLSALFIISALLCFL